MKSGIPLFDVNAPLPAGCQPAAEAFTSQELVYLAAGCRQQARQARPGERALFEELAAKCERMAQLVRSSQP